MYSLQCAHSSFLLRLLKVFCCCCLECRDCTASESLHTVQSPHPVQLDIVHSDTNEVETLSFTCWMSSGAVFAWELSGTLWPAYLVVPEWSMMGIKKGLGRGVFARLRRFCAFSRIISGHEACEEPPWSMGVSTSRRLANSTQRRTLGLG